MAYELADELDKAAERRRIELEHSGSLVGRTGRISTNLEPMMTPEQMKAIREANMGKKR